MSINPESAAMAAEREAELLARVRSGDQNASDELYRQCYREVVNFSSSRTRNSSDAEDVAQTALEKSWRNFDQYTQTNRTFKAWVMGIAKHTLTDYYRASAREIPARIDDGDIIATTDLEAEVVAQMTADEIWDRVEQRQGRLTDDEFDVLCQIAAGWTPREYAEQAEIQLGTARVRLHRARKKMQKDLRKVGLAALTDTTHTPEQVDDSL